MEYTNRDILKKFENKRICIIGRYTAVISSKTSKTRKLINRYLFKDVRIKGTNYVLDHLWVPGCEKNDLNFKVGYDYEIKGEIQKYFKLVAVDDTDLRVGKVSYKIEKITYKDIKEVNVQPYEFSIDDDVLILEFITPIGKKYTNQRAKVIDVTNEAVCLETHDHIIGGHNCFGKGKNEHCFWFYLDTINKNCSLDKIIKLNKKD